MRSTLPSIAAGEKSFSVALLHKILAVLDLPVDKAEIDARVAGPNTAARISELQKQRKIPADANTLVGAGTLAAIATALEERGLADATRSLTVMGAVRDTNGKPCPKQRLVAFDLDLRAVAVYNTVATIERLDRHGGAEFLGQTTSDGAGNYRVTFYEWQYRRAERGKADVVVYAIGDDGRRATEILGVSPIVMAADYSDAGVVRGTDVVITEDDRRTEFAALTQAVNPFLTESSVTLLEVAQSSEQLDFIASELGVDRAHVGLLGSAMQFLSVADPNQSLEVLYGIGRQNIELSAAVLARKPDRELRAAIDASVTEHIIGPQKDYQIDLIHAHAARRALETPVTGGGFSINTLLADALPTEAQRTAFIRAISSYNGNDFRDFWHTHLPAQTEFSGKPDLIAGLLRVQQLALLSGNHPPLVGELSKRGLASVDKLFDLDEAGWAEVIDKAGTPDFVVGETPAAKANAYANTIRSTLESAFPTQRIARMVKRGEIPIDKLAVERGVEAFLARSNKFDFAVSRISAFEKEIASVAGSEAVEVTRELKTMQRAFQISATPRVMSALLKNRLHSAHAVASIPRKSFVQIYGTELGGELVAVTTHQRAEYIVARSEITAMRAMEYMQDATPRFAMSAPDQAGALQFLEQHIANYATLFGSPDLCECGHCRSVYSPAAYLVDLLHFLRRSGKNTLGQTPLDLLKRRRPDLLHLRLTCENSDTLIPYIDLATEVMEFYTANGSLNGFEGYDTGGATADDLRARPQNFIVDAYKTLKAAKYPFSLPYHQPLDVVRTYSDHLTVPRYEVMKAINPQPNATDTAAIAAEALMVSQEECSAIAGVTFDGIADAIALHEYYGYGAAADLENLAAVPEFLRRTGIKYTDLVELLKTQFLNPHRDQLDFLQRLMSHASVSADTVYAKVKQVAAGTVDPALDADLNPALDAYNAAESAPVTAPEFASWAATHFAEFQQVITLYEPNSACNLQNTRLRTVESIYEAGATSGIVAAGWSKFHRFIRLWRKLGWSIHEIDLILSALGQQDITLATVNALEGVTLLKAASKQPLNQLAAMWGSIDTYGQKSLYRKLFLTKTAQRTNGTFEADTWGAYLQDGTQTLEMHQSAVLAALRIREEDLSAILSVARVIDIGVARALDTASDKLTLANISTIYRYVALAKALKLRVTDLCSLIAVFGSAPFSTWDMQQAKFVNIAAADTHAFYKLALAVKRAGFKASVLEYILKGTLPAASPLGLDRAKTLQTGKAIRTAFATIEQEHPDVPASPLTPDVVAAKLALTFQPDTVSVLMGILDGSKTFEVITDANLNVAIPADLAERFVYSKGSGRLACTGVMTDGEQNSLRTLANAAGDFPTAVDRLHDAPAAFITANFGRVFSDAGQAAITLLDHPAQAQPASLEAKLAFVYAQFVPLLKQKLRRDVITQHVAALIRLRESATALLIDKDVDALIERLSQQGFSGTYFSTPTWATDVLKRTDPAIDFDWGMAAPDALVPADNFSVRWAAYVSPPASGLYTFGVDVAQAGETFRLYLDDSLVREKAAGSPGISLAVDAPLNASAMHLLRLEYADAAQEAAVRLQWKTALSALTVLPASAAYPAAILDDFIARATLYHRAAKLITGFAMTDAELSHFITYSSDFANIDFNALTPVHWERLSDYVALRDAAPQAQALLTDVFALARTTSPAPTLAQLKEIVHRATAWDDASITFLADTHFALGVVDFRNEIALNRMRAVTEILAKTGLAAETAADWGRAATDFDTLNDTAQLIRNAVKAKYTEDTWTGVAGKLSDRIRETQKHALIAYLLTQPAIQAAGVTDADALFEHFLIDVQMGACMDSSRVVQASAAIQMFVNRSLLNLESDTSSGAERGVSPDAIDKARWQWMRNYRVWEANRKTFLYPENWLEPDWRRNRSEFFRDLESYLVQNDITDRTVEQAFRNYLSNLNEVANLDVCGLCEEYNRDGSRKYLHVFARTHVAPYRFFYRRWIDSRRWSSWERVPVDVRVVEDGQDEGADSGVPLVPVVWKGRLLLFVPEFRTVEEKADHGSASAKELGDQNLSTLPGTTYIEVRLAYTEYVDAKWTAKKVTTEMLRLKPSPSREFAKPKDLHFTPSIDASTNELSITVSDAWRRRARGTFVFADIQSPVTAQIISPKIRHQKQPVGMTPFSKYRHHFEKRATLEYKPLPLTLQRDVYLSKYTAHRLLPIDAMSALDITLGAPFFFSDERRAYFVRPVPIEVLKPFKNPDVYRPLAVAYLYGGANAADTALAPSPARTPAMALNRSVGAAASKSKWGYEKHEASATKSAFAGVTDHHERFTHREEQSLPVSDASLEFHTFYHPYAAQYVTSLNQDGVAGLLESDTTLASDEGTTFEAAYSPNFWHGMVRKPADFASRTYYKENVCFDVLGANSLYNWELFFHAPLYIATRLSKNGRFEEAMKWFHYIFDPTTDEAAAAGQSETARYWNVLPFKTTPAESLDDWFRALSPNADPASENAIIKEWRDNPFDPHLVAANRPLAYMKHVVMRYVENLLEWGDSLFRQFTRESVNEALQIYVIANHILGPRPQFVPKRGDIKAESYTTLEGKWDDFSNALVELENAFPYSSEAPLSTSASGPNLLGVGSALYFCIPPNDKLMAYWNRAADRLFKIRHCQDIDGVERSLALFAPPIDPAMLIQAGAQGLSLGSILGDLSSPPPIYRFAYLVQRANEFCGDVRALGGGLLAAIEKRDAEEMSRLRAAQESQMLDLMTGIRERAILEARATRDNLGKARESAWFRFQHYIGLVGDSPPALPPVPAVGATLTAESELPPDTTIATVASGVDDAPLANSDSGVTLIQKEQSELDSLSTARGWQIAGQSMELLAAIAHVIPTISATGTPLGVGVAAHWGGTNLGNALHATGASFDFAGGFYTYSATVAQKMASYIRREQEWTLQANLAAREIAQLDKQIVGADIRVQSAQIELASHLQQIENAKAVETFLSDKFTNQELYQWMREQLFAVYKQSYNMAYDMAKKAEKAFRYEMGTELASFIQYGYWDSAQQGLASGEKLQLALRQMEKAHIEDNRRELELTKSISLWRLNPLALIELRETGRCTVSLPEELFDLDFRGHYFRRIRSVSVSIPCVAGPYTTVGCSLRLLSNTVRINADLNSNGDYAHENDEGLWIDDDRFRNNAVPVTAIATSTGLNDSGMFEFNFRDERYLPFEYAGAISTWQIELSTDKDLRNFDYDTIADLILQLRYTARDAGGTFKSKATDNVKAFLANAADSEDQPLLLMLSMKHEFPTEWYRFLRPGAGADQLLQFTVGTDSVPFFAQGAAKVVEKIDLFAKCTAATTYTAFLDYRQDDDTPVGSSGIDLPTDTPHIGVNGASVGVTDAGLNLEEIDLMKPMTLKLRRKTAPDFTKLKVEPDEVEDVIVVLHYKLDTSGI